MLHIPRIHLSPKIKARSPRMSPRRNLYNRQREQFIANPTINPQTNRKIKIGSVRYKQLANFYRVCSN